MQRRPSARAGVFPPSPTLQHEMLETPVVLKARVWHTIDHAVTYNEGDEYSTDDPYWLSTLVGIGFVDIVGLEPPPIEPPPP
jgi:hypothetical protein